MKRAAVLIGVDKTGDLPRLKDAASGARLMQSWTQAQGIESVLIVDDAGPVTVKRIKDAIRGFVDRADVGQLLVYFAGHGVNIQRQEYWLLSEAPDDTQEAVNVFTSATLAATCGIGHVVLMSDACRTAPEGVRAQSVRGSEIFPNREEDARPVDQFFACQLGKPSHEIRDPAVTSAEFRALYTRELVPALLGQQPQIVEWTGTGAARIGQVHMRPLRDHLSAAVAARLVDLQLQTKVIQVPVAQISSDPPAWISEISAQAGAGGAAAPGGATVPPFSAPPMPPAPPVLPLPGVPPSHPAAPAASAAEPKSGAAPPAPTSAHATAAPQTVTTALLRKAMATGTLARQPSPAGAEGAPIAVRTGTVKWFDQGRGFGFISPDEDTADLFVHAADVKGTGLRSLRE
ncbi:MAG TPA: cold shock domain-containing protein, partial [Burkholderiaceae bacterium]|nr:cold shock domain-containing protein [Burkholderiaceae bacterium]